MKSLNFAELNLSNEVMKALEEMGFEEATPIQAQSIPVIMEGRNIIGQAQTGTGKTCAFGIPAIEKTIEEDESVQVLILCPTRELAIQNAEELRRLSKYKPGLRILAVYGGQPIDRQINALKKKPQIVIGTPGRIMDHMRRHTLRLSDLRILILDEADEMLNMGFRDDIDTILGQIPGNRQTILFSATMPHEIRALAEKYLRNPVNIKITHKELTVPNIEQYYLVVSEYSKVDVLTSLIDANDIRSCLVFCNTKKRVDELASTLQSRGYPAEGLHGDMDQSQRDRVMSRFRNGIIDILIATDVAARGIDVSDVSAVFNYDIPNDDEYYVHRIGRTGRAGRTGKAYSFVVGKEIYRLKEIQQYTRAVIRHIKPPTLQDIEDSKVAKILDGIKESAAGGNLGKYIDYIEKMLEDANGQNILITALDVAAALLKQAVGPTPDTENSLLYDNDEKFEDTGASEIGMVRLFINIGRDNNIQPKHIIEMIASNTSLPGKLIGSIDIYDKFTFVEVPREYAMEVLKSMKNHRMRGKKINIEKAVKKHSILMKGISKAKR